MKWWNDDYHNSSLLSARSTAARPLGAAEARVSTDSGREKKGKENAIKDETLSKQASAKIQEEGKSMRGEKREREERKEEAEQKK